MTFYEDKRGLLFCLFEKNLLVSNEKRGTLRGLHYQVYPYDREKVIQVISGSVVFMILDLTNGKGRWQRMAPGEVVSTKNYEACGYMTLADNTVLYYDMSRGRSAKHERGVRWNDPGIDWGEYGPPPCEDLTTINDRDRTFPDWSPCEP